MTAYFVVQVTISEPLKVPLLVRLVTALPWLQGIPARLLALGVRPEHVHSNSAPTP